MEAGGVENNIDPRARRAARAALAQASMDELVSRATETQRDNLDMHGHAVVKGVTVNWLAQVFHMDHRVVANRLKECPPLTRKRGGTGLLYDVAVAAEYLVKPRFNVEEYLKTMKVDELPPKLQEGFWAAALKRQKWEENAKRLWPTPSVVKKFSETFLMVANRMRLWVDDLDSVMEVTEPQRKALESCVRELQQAISHEINSLQRETKSQIAEMEEREVKIETAPTVEDEDDDDFAADIADVI